MKLRKSNSPPGDPAGDLDPEQRLSHLREQEEKGHDGWKRALVEAVLDGDLPLLYKDQALALLKKRAGSAFGYDPEAEDNAEAAKKMRAWAME